MDPQVYAAVAQGNGGNGAAHHVPVVVLDAAAGSIASPSTDTPAKRVIGRPFQKGHQLSKGRGRPPGAIDKRHREIRDLAQNLLNDKRYLRALERRLREGSAPHVETLLYHYAFGKPVERIKIQSNGSPADRFIEALHAAWQLGRGNGHTLPPAMSQLPAIATANGV